MVLSWTGRSCCACGPLATPGDPVKNESDIRIRTRYSRSVHKHERGAIMAVTRRTRHRSIRLFEAVSITSRGIRIWAGFRIGRYLRAGRPERMTRSRSLPPTFRLVLSAQ